MKVPFNKPVLLDHHLGMLEESIMSAHLSGNGPFTRKCEEQLERLLGKKTRMVTSATHALEMMALLTEIKPGDEVIVPSFTFVSTANAFVLRGAKLRFADNDEYGNILPSEIERLRTSRTRAVLVVDYAGAAPDFDTINEICACHSISVLEDAAQGIGSTFKGRPLGTLGDLGAISFHETKNITSGEGGALVFKDERFVAKAEIVREKGTNRTQFLMGLADKYTWVSLGSSFVLSDLSAAYLAPQLPLLSKINGKRKLICERYERELEPWFEKHGIKVLRTPAHNTPNHHIYAAVFPTPDTRNAFIAHMREAGVTCPFHYIPLHSSPFGQTFYDGGKPEKLEGCDRISGCLVRFPLFYNMTDDEQSYVVDHARKFKP